MARLIEIMIVAVCVWVIMDMLPTFNGLILDFRQVVVDPFFIALGGR